MFESGSVRLWSRVLSVFGLVDLFVTTFKSTFVHKTITTEEHRLHPFLLSNQKALDEAIDMERGRRLV